MQQVQGGECCGLGVSGLIGADRDLGGQDRSRIAWPSRVLVEPLGSQAGQDGARDLLTCLVVKAADQWAGERVDRDSVTPCPHDLFLILVKQPQADQPSKGQPRMNQTNNLPRSERGVLGEGDGSQTGRGEQGRINTDRINRSQQVVLVVGEGGGVGLERHPGEELRHRSRWGIRDVPAAQIAFDHHDRGLRYC